MHKFQKKKKKKTPDTNIKKLTKKIDALCQNSLQMGKTN